MTEKPFENAEDDLWFDRAVLHDWCGGYIYGSEHMCRGERLLVRRTPYEITLTLPPPPTTNLTSPRVRVRVP